MINYCGDPTVQHLSGKHPTEAEGLLNFYIIKGTDYPFSYVVEPNVITYSRENQDNPRQLIHIFGLLFASSVH